MVLRLSRSHDQNRRRAGETAGKAAPLAVQCDVLSGRTGRILLTDTGMMENRADELPGERASWAEKGLYLNR